MKKLLVLAALALMIGACAPKEYHFNEHAIIVPNGVYCTDDPTVIGPKAKRHFVIPADPGKLFEKEGDK